MTASILRQVIMSIRHWPAERRPREKLLQHGPQALSDAELLAIFLRTGVSGVDAVTLAQQLLDHFGSLDALLDADRDTFCAARGLGEAKYVQLQAVLEMARRYFETRLRQHDTLSDPESAARYLMHQLPDTDREHFMALFLDNAHRLIQCEVLFSGTLAETAVYPREVARHALQHNAAAVIVAHNHPSGLPIPSEADRVLTRQLVNALHLLEIRLLDHLILAPPTWHSLHTTHATDFIPSLNG